MSESLAGNEQDVFDPDLILEQARQNMEIQPTEVSTDPTFYDKLTTFEGGHVVSRTEHIENHYDSFQRLGISNFEIALQEFNKLTTETDPNAVMQFRDSNGSLLVYSPKTELFVVVQDRPTKKIDNPPPPAFVKTAFIRTRASVARKLSGQGRPIQPNQIQ